MAETNAAVAENETNQAVLDSTGIPTTNEVEEQDDFNREDMIFTIGNRKFSADEYPQAAYDYLKRNGEGEIHPEAILGFSIGEPLCFDKHLEVGLRHPKVRSYYEMQIQGEGDESYYVGDQKFRDLFVNIRACGQFLEPILVYLDEETNSIAVLNGATRLSAIAYILADDASAFQKIPVRVFKGTKSEAQHQMIALNDADNFRPLTQYEIMEAVYHLKSDEPNITDAQVCIMLGKNPETYTPTLSTMRKVRQKTSAELRAQFALGNVNMNVMKKIADAGIPKSEQSEYVDRIKKGEKLTGSDIKSNDDTVAAKKIRPMGKIAQMSEYVNETIIPHLKGMKKYSSVKEKIDAFLESHQELMEVLDGIYNPTEEPAE